MKKIRWDVAKNTELKKNRGVSFEEIIQTSLVAVKEHPKRRHQSILLFEHCDYLWVVPYVEEKGGIFLKTLFPSRKYTKMWKEGKLT